MYGFGFSMIIHLGIVIIGFLFDLFFRGKGKKILVSIAKYIARFFSFARRRIGGLFASPKGH